MLPVEFFAPFKTMCIYLRVDPVDLLSVAANESGLNAAAHNKNGHASGLWQLMPATAKGLGWDVASDPELAAFRALGPVAQLPWWQRYFAPHRGQLVNAAACYVATFLPALVPLAANLDAVLCARDGSSDGPKAIVTPVRSVSWYSANTGLDADHDGKITTRDLLTKITQATKALGSTWTDAVSKLEEPEQTVFIEPDDCETVKPA